jgi:flagellar hook-basal body protein
MSFNVALTGAFAATKAISVTSDNIANAGTNAFKARNLTFSDIYSSSTFGVQKTTVGNGTQVEGVKQSTSAGPIATTGNALDLAITGHGFFVVAPPSSGETDVEAQNRPIQYTRNGSFKVDNVGKILTSEDFSVLGVDGKPLGLPTVRTVLTESTFNVETSITDALDFLAPFNGSTLKFSTLEPGNTVSIQDDTTILLDHGEISLSGGLINYTPLASEGQPLTSVKLGGYNATAEGSIEIHFLDEISYQKPTYVDFSTEDWVKVADRFYSGITEISDAPSYTDTTFGVLSSGDSAENSTVDFDITTSPSGISVDLITSGWAAAGSTIKGPYVYSANPIFIAGGSSLNFEWNADGTTDTADFLAYLRKIETGEFVEAVNFTGEYLQETSAAYTFSPAVSGNYQIVFVGGSYDSNNGGLHGAKVTLSKLSFSSQSELVDVVLDGNLIDEIGKKVRIDRKDSFGSIEEVPLENSNIPLMEVSLKNDAGLVKMVDMTTSRSSFSILSDTTNIKRFNNLTVDADGFIDVSIVNESGAESVRIGQLAIAGSPVESDFVYRSNGYFRVGPNSQGLAHGNVKSVGSGSILQGALEKSNVEMTQQLTSLIEGQRVFQANSRMLQAYLDANEQLSSIR